MTRYKLGSQLQKSEVRNGVEIPIFEWNLCQLDDRGTAVAWIYLGDLPSRHPVVDSARVLVTELNRLVK